MFDFDFECDYSMIIYVVLALVVVAGGYYYYSRYYRSTVRHVNFYVSQDESVQKMNMFVKAMYV